MGAEGVRVDELDQVGPALTAAVDAQMNEGKTTVIEIMCTQGARRSVPQGRAEDPGALPRQVQGLCLTFEASSRDVRAGCSDERSTVGC